MIQLFIFCRSLVQRIFFQRFLSSCFLMLLPFCCCVEIKYVHVIITIIANCYRIRFVWLNMFECCGRLTFRSCYVLNTHNIPIIHWATVQATFNIHTYVHSQFKRSSLISHLFRTFQADKIQINQVSNPNSSSGSAKNIVKFQKWAHCSVLLYSV